MAEFKITIQTGEGGTETPETIKNKLETLLGASRLHATAIQGLGDGGYQDIYDIISDLEDLVGDQRLDASAIKNLPSGTAMTPAEIKAALETLSGNDRLSGLKVNLAAAGAEMVTALSALQDSASLSFAELKQSTRVKYNVSGCERALNLRGFGNVWSSQEYRDSYMTAIKKGDFWVQSDPSTAPNVGDGASQPPGGISTPPALNGDWWVALDNIAVSPTQITLGYTDKWLKMPFGQLYTVYNFPVWVVDSMGGGTSDTKLGNKVPLIIKTEEVGASFYGSGSEAQGPGSIALGLYNKTEAGADLSLTHGKGSKAVNYAERSMAATMMNNPGDLQSSSFMLYHTSSNNSPQIVSTPQNPVLAPISSNVVEIEGTASSEDATVMAHFIKKYLISVDHTNTITATLISGSQTNIGTDAEDMTIDVVPTVATESGNPVTRLNLTATGLGYVNIVWNFRVNHIQTVFKYNVT